MMTREEFVMAAYLAAHQSYFGDHTDLPVDQWCSLCAERAERWYEERAKDPNEEAK